MTNINKNNLEELANEWFLKAQDDELSTKDILNDKEGAPSTVCFLSQQMAEKFLKGYLVYKEKELSKIHDLDRLIKLCEEIDTSFVEIKDYAKGLSDFYISTRYPGDYPQFTWPQAETAFASATRIKRFVLERIK